MLTLLQKKLQRKDYSNYSNIEVVEGSAYSLPFAKHEFDLIYMVCVLQELRQSSDEAILEFYRVLKPGGIIAVTEHFEDPDFVLSITTQKQLEKHGFSHVETLGNWVFYTIRMKKEI